MARPFKKQVTRYYTPDGKRCQSDTPGAVRRVEESRKYYGLVPKPGGKRKAVALCPDLSRSKTLLNKLLADAAMRQHGMTDPYEEHRKRSLDDHLADFRRELEGRGNEVRYVSVVASRLTDLLTGCGFVFMADLSASRVADWLTDLRRKGKPRVTLDPNKEWYTVKEAAAVLGMKPLSVGTAIRRHRLEAVGVGSARRLPRTTVEALQDRGSRGVSVETSNQYLSHLKSFCRWLVKDRRMPDNPLAHLEAGNADLDRRHDRRELTADELRGLLSVTRNSPRWFRWLTGSDRFHLYATACATGFRAAALAGLTPDAFDLGGDTPTVTLAARRNKSRKTKVQPIPRDVAELLREYLRDKPAGQPVWNGTGTWAKDHKGAEMLRLDLEAAGIPYAVEGPDGPLFADFHALRHSYITLLGRGGVDLRTAQELAGHSTPNLTARYSHRRLHDLAGAVEKLPRFIPAEGASSEATPCGTLPEELTTNTVAFGCSLVARTPVSEGQLVAPTRSEAEGEQQTPEVTEPQVSPGFSHLLASPDVASLKGG